VISGLFWACINASWIPWQLNLIPSRTGVYMGLLNFVNGMEWAIGPEIGGFLGQYAGVWASAGASSALVLVGLSLLIRVPDRAEPDKPL